MKTKNVYFLLFAVAGLLVIYIIYDTVSQPGIADMEGNYVEISKYRNENNTGPVIRIYAIYTTDRNWEEMRAYGDLMPHTKYGNTKVFFFDQNINSLNLEPDSPHFDQKWEANCLAVYEKSAMGTVNFQVKTFDN